MKTTIKALLVILTFAFFSCQKNDVIEPSASTDLSSVQLKSATIAVNDVAVESVSDEASYETYFYGEYEHLLRQLAQSKGRMGNLMAGQTGMHYMNGSMPNVTIDNTTAGYPISITVDYGTGIETHHGSLISGKVVIEISGEMNVDGSTRTISFINCVIDSIGINGKNIETFNGDNLTTTKMTTLSDVKFTLVNGTVISRVGNNVKEWLKGMNTQFERDDDMMQITGTINVTSSTGDNYSRVISDPLIRLGDCSYPVKGIVKYNQNGNEIASLDYGTGVCDNLAELTSNGKMVEIVLKDHAMPEAMTDGQHHNMGGNGSMGGNNNTGGNGMMNGNGSDSSNGNGTMNGTGNTGTTGDNGMMNGNSSSENTSGNGMMNGNGSESTTSTGTMNGTGNTGTTTDNGMMNGNSGSENISGNGMMNGNSSGSTNGTGTMNGNGSGTTNGTGTMNGNGSSGSTTGTGMMGGSGH